MSYNLHELYTARTNLNLGLTASLRKITHLPLKGPNFWEGEMGMMEHVLQYFPEPKRATTNQNELLVIPASENSTMTNLKQGNPNGPGVFGENKQASTSSPIMNNSTIETDKSVSLFHPLGSHKKDIENKTLIPPQGEIRQESKINSMPFTESQKRVTPESNLQSESEPYISYIVISDDDSDVEIVIDVNKKGHLKNDGHEKERQFHTKITAGTDYPGNSEDNVKQNLNTLRRREKLLSSEGFGNRLENTENANKTSKTSHIHSESSDVCQKSSNNINCDVVSARLHQTVDSNHQSPEEDSSEQLIHEIKKSKAKLKVLSKNLKSSKPWVKSAQYKQFVSFQTWIKQVECKLKDKVQLTKNIKRQNRYHNYVDAEEEQWIIAKRAFLDFKNMYETIRKNRCDLFPNS